VLFGCNQCNVTWLVNGNRPTDGRLSRFFVVVAARLRTDNNNDNNDNKNPAVSMPVQCSTQCPYSCLAPVICHLCKILSQTSDPGYD